MRTGYTASGRPCCREQVTKIVSLIVLRFGYTITQKFSLQSLDISKNILASEEEDELER